MKIIWLTKGQICIIDDIDCDLSNQHWRAHTYKNKDIIYAQNSANKYIHQIIAERIIKRELNNNEQVDHIDRDGLNNSRSNLRVVDKYSSIQNTNKSKFKNTSSKYIGVSYHIKSRKWRAQIQRKYKNILIGYFNTEEEAHKARISFESTSQ